MNTALIFLGGYLVGLVIGWALGMNNTPREPDESLLKYLHKPIPFKHTYPYYPKKEKK